MTALPSDALRDPDSRVRVAVATPSRVGESPLWHPREQCLYWVDIPGRLLNRFDPATGAQRQWPLDAEPGCCAPMDDAGMLLAMRDGLWRFDTRSATRAPLTTPPPYDPAHERFNDGKCDPQGRLWVGTIWEPRNGPRAALYRFAGGALDRIAGNVTVSNGLAWSPDGATMYWSDTSAHTVKAFDFDCAGGTPSRPRVFARWPRKRADQALSTYGGRPDGAAVDAEGCYWVAMFEGQRVLRLSPAGDVLREVVLPARCPTMPCFGGADLKTVYVTTARENRAAAELVATPLAGCVFAFDVDVPGLPAAFFTGGR